jgi:hypothetical protein
MGEFVQGIKKKSLEHIPWYINKYSWNIFMPCAFKFCDMEKYYLVKLKIFFHVDKSPM